MRLDPALADWHVIRPQDDPPLDDPRDAFRRACATPIASPPLHEAVSSRDRVVIVTSDGTRPVPNRLLIPWLLEELPVPAGQVTVLIGTGTHRPNTPGEIEAMFGEEVTRRVRIVNHDAFSDTANTAVGRTSAGAPICLNRVYAEADKRIALGFIEPHFFAGFSGGPKAIAPGIASIESILCLHSYDRIGDPKSTWGVIEDNPVHQAIREMAAACPPDFIVNVALNNRKEITAFFAGDCSEAHKAGCAHVHERAMARVPHRFPLVVISNTGFPLDQNLYQSVKGMSAAARIVESGGTVFMAAECADGIPAHGNFGALLADASSVDALDARLCALERPLPDQWQAQVLVQVRRRCEVCLYSSLSAETARRCLMTPVDDLAQTLHQRLRAIGPRTPVAVLPEGPLSVPYLAGE